MGTLYVAATPIGNLSDITLRVLEVLKKADLILAEDTRQTQKLLERYRIKKPLLSFHQHSRLQKLDRIVRELKTGKSLVLVSDAGTPGVSDPGGVLVEKIWSLRDHDMKIVPLPGPSALMTAASVSGLSLDKFEFLGFFPKKKGRQTLLENLVNKKTAVIFYESPYRIIRTLADLKKYLGDSRQIFIARELTKKFEELFRGNIAEAARHFTENKTVKGEIVVVLARK